MNYQAGASFYSQNLRPNTGNQNYYNNSNNKNNDLIRKNQVNANNNINIAKAKSNLKYGDLEIQTFFNNGNGEALSSRDVDIQNRLQCLTNQYMSIFDEVNRYTSEAGGQSAINKLSEIKTHFKDLDTDFGKEHENFISELFGITNDNQLYNYDYEKFKRNPRETDSKLAEIFRDKKYDILIEVNKDVGEENIRRLKNYVKDKKPNNNYNDNKDYENKNNYNAYNNNNNSSQQSFGYGNSIYAGQQANAFTGRSIYGNQPSYGRKIKVKFIYKGKDYIREIEGNEKAEILYSHAWEIKGDNPTIYREGTILNIDNVKDWPIENLFGGMEPVLTIY
jgi:hypothetical protein